MKRIGIIVTGIILLFVFLSIFFTTSTIAGTNMEPAVKNGHWVVYRTAYPNINPQRSDIVLYSDPERPDVDHIGRIIGMPSESVRIGKGNVYIDTNSGKFKLIEEYLPTTIQTQATQENRWVKLPEYSYLILKDNRDNYDVVWNDSIIHQHHIKGKLIFAL